MGRAKRADAAGFSPAPFVLFCEVRAGKKLNRFRVGSYATHGAARLAAQDDARWAKLPDPIESLVGLTSESPRRYRIFRASWTEETGALQPADQAA